MKTKFKSILALTLVLVLILSAFTVPGAVVHAVDSSAISPRLLFADDCNTDNGTISSTWAVGSGTATADGEKYTVSKGYIYLPCNQGMQDYIVQADISIPNTTYGEGIFANKGSAAICVRHDPTADSGYEYGVIVGRDTADSANVRLYGRNSSSALNQSSPIADALYEGDTAQALSTNVYTCKVQVSGSQIIGYVNGVQVFDITNTDFTHGTVALKALNCVATFDNVKIIANELLVSDDFSQPTTTTQRGWNLDRTVKNGEMVAVGASTYLSRFAGVENWSNYSVEAYARKVYNTATSSSKGTVTGVIAGAKGSSRSGLEFAVIDYNTAADWSGNYDSQTLRIYDPVAKKSLTEKIVDTYDAAAETVEQAWASRPYKPEDGLTLKLQIINYGDSGKAIGYINGKEVISAEVDNTTSLIGAPGVMTTGGHTAYFDNFKVYNEYDYLEEKTAETLTLVNKNGDEISSLGLYRGFEIETTDYRLFAAYSNGTEEYVSLAREYISYGENGLQLGENQVTISYKGGTLVLPVTVTERPDYVSDFCSYLLSVNPNTLTADDAGTVSGLKEMYDLLSPYEVQNLPQNVKAHYAAVTEAMDRIRIPETEGQALILADDFSDTELNTDHWDTQRGELAGKWFVRNGYALNDQAPYSQSSASWVERNSFHCDASAIEVDICINAAGVYSAVAFNYDGYNYYHARITNRNVYRVELYKYNGKQVQLGNVSFSKLGITGKNGEFYTLRVTEVDGLIQVYVNGILAIAYDDSADKNFPRDGGIAFRNLYNTAFYDNLRIYGEAMDPDPNEEKDIDPTEYTDDFEDETVGASPSHWVEDYNYKTNQIKDDWKVYNKSGNKVYGTTATAATYTWLHAFEIDPTYTARFMYSGSGKTGFVTRLYDELSWLVLGYDTAKSQWFMAATESTVEEETQVVWGSTQALAANTWHTAQILLQGKTVTLTVNGTVVLQCDAVSCNSFGRMGVFSKGMQTYVDDIYVKSVSGTTFVEGVIDYSIVDGTKRYGGYLEIENLGNGHLVGACGSKQFHSYDNGETWKEVTDTDAAYDIAADGMGYTSILNLGNGKWIQARISWDNARVLVSNDNMATWEVAAEKIGSDEYVDQYGNDNLVCVHVNSLTKGTVNGKTRIFWPLTFRRYNEAGTLIGHYTRFFYSDDGGYTWTESENDTRDVLPGYAEGKSSTTAEGKVIQCADGSLRYYQTRNDYGNMIYFESVNGGESWTGFGTVPYMQCPKGSFSVTEDTYNPGTYYLVWVHNYPVKLGSIQPRVRISLAKSTNGKDWEFLCDVERTSIYANATHNYVRQFLDPNIVTTEDYVYVTYGRSNVSIAGSPHNNQIQRYVRFEKDKLSVRPWDDATISDTNRTHYLEVVTAKTEFALNEEFTLDGGIIREVSLNGATKERKMRNYTLVSDQPDTSKPGVYTVTLANHNLHLVSYQVYVGTTYGITWDIQGAGTVQGRVDKVLQGEGFTFTLLPDEGYEIGSVTVNGTAVELQENAYTVENIQKDTAISIVFSKIPTYIAGDLNDDGKVTDADAVHLLMHTFFPDTYPVNQPVDYNGDGKITDADAVHLLMYTFFPDTYPIN